VTIATTATPAARRMTFGFRSATLGSGYWVVPSRHVDAVEDFRLSGNETTGRRQQNATFRSLILEASTWPPELLLSVKLT